MGCALALALVAGGALGTLAAVRRGTAVDQLFALATTAGLSIPVFWLGLAAIYIFSILLGLLPAGGREPIAAGVGWAGRAAHLALPASVLAVAWCAAWSRYLRAGLVEILEGDFIRTARAKGLAERSVVLKHAMRGAVLPAVTVLFMQLPALFTGAVITETVFAWPGMGRLFYEGLQRQDSSRVLGIIVISSLLIILMNTLGDIVCMVLDPRIRSASRERRAKGGAG
jgi:peptide/nickel transport system permease protein